MSGEVGEKQENDVLERARQLILFRTRNPMADYFPSKFFSSIPERPGVYFMKGEDGELLYVGKAKNLRARLKTYRYTNFADASRKTIRLIRRIRQIEWEVTRSEKKALLRENQLLRQHQPPFNVLNTYTENYSFLNLWMEEPVIRLKISRDMEAKKELVYGCFKGRERIRRAIQAIHNLFRALEDRSGRDLPAYFQSSLRNEVEIRMKDLRIQNEFSIWSKLLKRYLKGTSSALLKRFEGQLIPEQDSQTKSFLNWVIREELNALEEFYRLGPLRLKRARKLMGIKRAILEKDEIDDAIVELQFCQRRRPSNYRMNLRSDLLL